MCAAGGGGVSGVGSVAGGLYSQNMVMGSWCAPYDALQRPTAYGNIHYYLLFYVAYTVYIRSLLILHLYSHFTIILANWPVTRDIYVLFYN